MGCFQSFAQCSPDVTDPVTPTLPTLMGECFVTASAPTTTDFCDGVITATTGDPITYLEEGTYTINWTFTDMAGNSITVPQTVIVDDVTDPVPDIVALPDVTMPCVVNGVSAPTASDNCEGILTGTTATSFPITTLGTTVVVWNFDDGNGNVVTQNQNIIVTDNVAPVPDVGNLPDVTSECEVTSIAAPSATDACQGTILGTTSALFPITTQGTTVITWTYDDGNGNITTQDQTVILDDQTNPVLDVASLPQIDAICSVTTLVPPTASDACVGSITGVSNVTLPITTQGPTTVLWTFDDGNGNVVSQTQMVVLMDDVAPVPDATELADIMEECSVTSLTAPTASDNCAGTISGTHDAILPIVIPGTTVVTWTFDDGNGNLTVQTQQVYIDDLTPPTPDAMSLADITSDCELTTLIPPTATDNCGGFVTVENDAVLPIQGVGTYAVTWTYTDPTGNISAQTQNVIIVDNDPPVADLSTLQPIVVDCQILSFVEPLATDACGGEVIIVSDTVGPMNVPGDYTITWTFTDDQGNQSTETQLLTINQTEACFELITINDVITPNGDDKNQYWVLENEHYLDGCNVSIFNRWGDPVYESVGYDNMWSGQSESGEALPDGVYYYVIQCDNDLKFNGYITILK